MRVFYQCFGRAHTSVLAAHIHLGNLPCGNTPSVAEIMALPFFDQASKADLGRPLFFGRDPDGHEIYAIGFGFAIGEGLSAIHSVFRRAGVELPLVVNTLKGLGILARVGGCLSRELGLVALGRPIVAHGILGIYRDLLLKVAAVKEFLKEVTG